MRRRRAVSRRTFLAITGGIVLALSTTVAVVRKSGYDVPPPTREPLTSLEPWQYVVVQHLARRICAADVGGVVSSDETDVAGFVDAYVAEMPAKLRRDLMRFLAYVEQLAPAAIFMTSRFTRLPSHDQDRVLASIESSSIDLLRGGFDGVKALLFMGFYRDPRTWSVIGYDGPLIGRDAEK